MLSVNACPILISYSYIIKLLDLYSNKTYMLCIHLHLIHSSSGYGGDVHTKPKNPFAL